MVDIANEILPVNIEDELKQSYLDYAMSVIVGRALPDVRDGLKPVHRRVLFAMHELSNDWNKPYKKSANIVGAVMGNFHPHGDSAIYDALVRMAQPFSMSVPLVKSRPNSNRLIASDRMATTSITAEMVPVMRRLRALMKSISDFNSAIMLTPAPQLP